MPPEHDPRTADAAIEERASRLLAAMNALAAEQPTSFRDESPLPRYGDSPPVAQPGIPPMSQRGTEVGRLMMYGGLATVPPGIVLTAVLVASEHADPTVVGLIFGAPVALVLALARLMRRAKDVLPAEHHHHYNGPVRQEYRQVHNETRGFGRSTTNL